MRKCKYCDKDELVGIGPDNTPVCEKHFADYLKGKRLEIDIWLSESLQQGGD